MSNFSQPVLRRCICFDKLLNLLLCSLRLKDSPEGPAKMCLPVRHQGAHSWKRQLLPPFWVVPYCLHTKMEAAYAVSLH